MGADVAIDYHDDVPTAVAAATGGQGVDVILDVLGAGARPRTSRCWPRAASSRSSGCSRGWRPSWISGSSSRSASPCTAPRAGALAGGEAEIVAGAARYAPYIEPSVHAVLPLRRAGEAHAMLHDQGTFGKLVLQVRWARPSAAGAHAPGAHAPRTPRPARDGSLRAAAQ